MTELPSAEQLSSELTSIGTAVLGYWPNPMRIQRDRPGQRFVQLLTVRSNSTFQSIILLLDHGRHDEAAVLLRRLLEDSLRASYIAEYPNRADGLALKLAMDQLTKTVKQLEKLVRAGHEQVRPMLDERRESRAALDRIASVGAIGLKNFPGPEQIAEIVDRPGDPLQ